MTSTKLSPETGEADVKAASDFVRANNVFADGCKDGFGAYVPEVTVSRFKELLASALASARAEGEAAGKRDHHRNWPDCPSCVKWANDDMSASEAYSKGEAAGFEAGQALMHAHCLADEINQHRQEWEAAGAAKERAAVVQWMREDLDSSLADEVEAGGHVRWCEDAALRALTPEGKR